MVPSSKSLFLQRAAVVPFAYPLLSLARYWSVVPSCDTQ